jgi:hypothetical protein
MALSNPRAIFGVHSVTPYSRTDGSFYGELKVLKSSSISLAGQLIELMGGSSKYSWAAEDGQIQAEMSLKFSEYPDFLFTLFLGLAPTANGAEASGSVTTLTNVSGSTLKHATTGIASVALKSGSSADLKFGSYVVAYASATTVDVFYGSDVDIARGTNGTYQNDLLKITATPLTITTGATLTTITNFGIDLVGGSGTIGLTAGTTATFTVRPPNSASSEVLIGASANSTFPEFGCIIMTQKRGNQEMASIEAYRCKGAGMPISFDQNAWSEADVKVKLLYDSAVDAVFKFTHIKPTGT